MSIKHPLGATPRPGNEFATLGGGCFWCLEAVFEEVDGVVDVESGYSGGHTPQPTYEEVCAGSSGHAEVARIEFEPTRISFRELIEVFFTIHDPTTLNRQGNDIGEQYRSVIFVHSEAQRATAELVIRQMRPHFDEEIVTLVVPVTTYTRAETAHQEYFRHNPAQGYCMFVIAPKLEKFRHAFAARRRPRQS